ncbi:MAG: hypothetical protein ABR498_02840 [Candidatus Dormibacteria bacterium]
MRGNTAGQRKASLRLALVLAGSCVAAAGVGFGGFSAWQVTTENDGNAFTIGAIHHTNTVGSATCNDSSVTPATTCAVIYSSASGAYAAPGDSLSGTVTINIPSSSTLSSTMTLGPAASNPYTNNPSSSSLCSNLQLTITDGESGATTGNVYGGASGASLASFTSPVSVKTSGTSSTWNSGNSDTFTFTVTYPAVSGGNPISDMGSSCTAKFLFTQSA